jgi:hypothetical protein
MQFFICKNILKKISCYHDNYFIYFMFGKCNGFVSKARVSACMYFLVINVMSLKRRLVAPGRGDFKDFQKQSLKKF